jgi:hypothetical protein
MINHLTEKSRLLYDLADFLYAEDASFLLVGESSGDWADYGSLHLGRVLDAMERIRTEARVVDGQITWPGAAPDSPGMTQIRGEILSRLEQVRAVGGTQFVLLSQLPGEADAVVDFAGVDPEGALGTLARILREEIEDELEFFQLLSPNG